MKNSTPHLLTYVTGFILSVALTLAAYFLATQHMLSPELLIAGIVALAAIQFIVQMVCFLHLGTGVESRERFIVLCFAAVIVVILVGGSLWIMNNLNNRMMPTTAQMEQYMDNQTGI